jgi:hypothetical protein
MNNLIKILINAYFNSITLSILSILLFIKIFMMKNNFIDIAMSLTTDNNNNDNNFLIFIIIPIINVILSIIILIITLNIAMKNNNKIEKDIFDIMLEKKDKD